MGACSGFPDGMDLCLPTGCGDDSYPSGGCGFVSGVIRSGCVPGGSLGSLFTNGLSCNPTWFAVWLGASQCWWWGLIFPKWPPPEKHTLMNIPKSFASNVLPPQWVTVTLCFPRRFSKKCSQVWPRFLGSLCFALGTSACEILYAPFKNWVSIFPSLMELLYSSPTDLQCQMLWGLFMPIPDPQEWGLDVGLRTLTPTGEYLW